MGKSRIPELLVKYGKTQADLAAYLGVTEGFISQVCRGRSHLSVVNMKKAALFFNCTMDDLVEWIIE